MKQKNPQFICIGAAKAGTTWLYEVLKRHERIRLPPYKEVHFFDQLQFTNSHRKKKLEQLKARGLDSAAITQTEKWANKENLTIDDYSELFDFYADYVSGDITPAYATLDQKCIQDMKNLCPNAKVFYLLRNPIERTWSHIRFAHSIIAKKPISSLELNYIKEMAFSPTMLTRSDYNRTIDSYQAIFRENFFIFFYDDITDRPVTLISRILELLGLDFDREKTDLDIINRKVNSSPNSQIPKEIEIMLAKHYIHDLQRLNSRLGGGGG